MARSPAALLLIAACCATTALCAHASRIVPLRKSARSQAGWTSTPAGLMPEECVHHVPHDSHVEVRHDEEADVGRFVVTHADGSVEVKPPCPYTKARDELSTTAPEVYDGWLEYTAFKSKPGLDVFLGNFSVPDQPQQAPQVLYLFTGLQNVDWIPLKGDAPENFYIIQPVLQYPGDFGDYWSVKSWYVTVDAGAVHTDEAKVTEEDEVVFGNMTRVGPQSYFIGSTLVRADKTVKLTATHSRLSTSPWAYNTLECYGCNGCATYPTQPCKFSALQLSNDGNAVKPVWEANPKPSSSRMCKESVSIAGPDAVTISFT